MVLANSRNIILTTDTHFGFFGRLSSHAKKKDILLERGNSFTQTENSKKGVSISHIKSKIRAK
jgi:hypothetical protein